MADPNPFESPEPFKRRVPKRAVPIEAVGGAFAIGVLVALATSWAYAYLARITPVLQLSFVLCVVFGCVVGWATASASSAIRVRTAVLLLAAVAATAGLYSAWAADAVMRLGKDAMGVSYRPDFLARYAHALYERGSFTFRDEIVRGPKLAFVWLSEAILVVGAAIWASKLRSKPSRRVCPWCQNWLREEFGAARLSVDGVPESALRQLSSGDLSGLYDLKPANWEEPAHLRVDLVTCPICNNGSQLAVTLVSFSNQPEIRLIDNVTIMSDEARAFRDLKGNWNVGESTFELPELDG